MEKFLSNNIKVSLIIPTRERAETLKYTIQTALNQQLEEYEVIVSDNFSQDNTKEVVESFNDSRLKYINTSKRVSMTENFEFGVSHAKGEYIVIIGDDDGVMPNAIDKLGILIDTHPSKLYSWPRHIYNWPSIHSSEKLERIAKVVEHTQINLTVNLKKMLINGLLLNSKMPNSYHSATHRSIFENIKKLTGRVYQSTIPDEFMLFILPVFCEHTVFIGESLTVDGHSPKSNSGSLLHSKKSHNKNSESELDKFVKEQNNYQLHKSIPPNFPRTASLVVDTFLVARELFPEFYANLKINYSAMWAYGWNIFKLNNILKPIAHRRELQVHESFNSIIYIIYYSLFFIYLRIFKACFPRSNYDRKVQRLFLQSSPKNIVEFVEFCHANKVGFDEIKNKKN